MLDSRLPLLYSKTMTDKKETMKWFSVINYLSQTLIFMESHSPTQNQVRFLEGFFNYSSLGAEIWVVSGVQTCYLSAKIPILNPQQGELYYSNAVHHNLDVMFGVNIISWAYYLLFQTPLVLALWDFLFIDTDAVTIQGRTLRMATVISFTIASPQYHRPSPECVNWQSRT